MRPGRAAAAAGPGRDFGRNLREDTAMPHSKLLPTLLLASAATLLMAADDAPMHFHANLGAAAEVPPNDSTGTGAVDVTVVPSTKAMTYTGEYKGLTGPATAAHFHGPAEVGANAPVVIPIPDKSSPLKGAATLTDAQMADLEAGKYYVNVHTAAHPAGEIRGQVSRAK